ncbi:hypothetical protein NDK43_03560 [Neobacillus pocheonensis]|uniref:Uncharacterized protein n=1 Tax=Neobacillus pocheonensis TaxID=363869 RepID=A0ABT0W5N3_9BACI|nr:hypothetical protein [Neobacillus pocheonensis]
MKKISLLLGIFLLIFATTFFYEHKNPKVQESITFFPIDPKVTYKITNTSLRLIDQKPAEHDSLLWRITSTLDQIAYLRQDAGLLFSNGRLVGELRYWKQNTTSLTQEKQIVNDKSAIFEAITFHHAELHEKGNQIFSSQALSEDHLYLIHSASSKKDSFRSPMTQEESEWKQRLDEQTRMLLQYSWSKGTRYFSIPLNNYQAFPLNLFNEKAKTGLPGFTSTETARIIGNLWEGLYKNYFLGIKKADGTIVSPIGSTIPLILVANNKTHLLVLTETANGEPILLRQRIKDVD